MAASGVFGGGEPQFLAVRSINPSVNYATGSVTWSTTAQDGLGGTTTPFTGATASHIISAGPQTTGPVYVAVNGAMWALPFNYSFSCPDYVIKALDSTIWTFL